MITGLDRIVVAANDVAAATQAYSALLGQPTSARFQLDNVALEVMPTCGEPEGLRTVVFAVQAIDATREGLERRGIVSAAPDAAGLAYLEPACTGGVGMALCQAASTGASAPSDDAVAGLDHVVIRTRNADRAVAIYGARLGLDFRLDRSNPQWAARLLFFRCGQSIVEISAPLGAVDPQTPDRIEGLAWRVADPRAAQVRLAGLGFDVSAVRKGRKPGTAVFTLRSGVVGAPSLLIGPAAP